MLAALNGVLVGATCFQSADLTTTNPATTPANNSIAGLPGGAFTPQTDRNVISPNPPNRTPITKVVPGLQISGYFADDPTTTLQTHGLVAAWGARRGSSKRSR